MRARNFVFSDISLAKRLGKVGKICLVKMCSGFVTLSGLQRWMPQISVIYHALMYGLFCQEDFFQFLLRESNSLSDFTVFSPLVSFNSQAYTDFHLIDLAENLSYF